MTRKDIVLISGMLLFALVVFLTTWLTFHQDISGERAVAQSVSDQILSSKVPSALTRTANRDSRTPRAFSMETSSKISTEDTDTEHLSQEQVSLESLLQRTTSQEDSILQEEANTTIYTALHESFQYMDGLRAQVQAITDDLKAQVALIGTGRKIDPAEYSRKLDESDAIQREILTICKAAQTIAPEAIEIKEVYRTPMPIYETTMVSYAILIRRERLEEAFGTMPEDVARFFPDIAATPLALPADENFSYVEADRELARRRAAQQR